MLSSIEMGLLLVVTWLPNLELEYGALAIIVSCQRPLFGSRLSDEQKRIANTSQKSNLLHSSHEKLGQNHPTNYYKHLTGTYMGVSKHQGPNIDPKMLGI